MLRHLSFVSSDKKWFVCSACCEQRVLGHTGSTRVCAEWLCVCVLALVWGQRKSGLRPWTGGRKRGQREDLMMPHLQEMCICHHSSRTRLRERRAKATFGCSLLPLSLRHAFGLALDRRIACRVPEICTCFEALVMDGWMVLHYMICDGGTLRSEVYYYL